MGSNIIGDLRIYKGLTSLRLENERDITVWLPPSYASSQKRYPVVYIQDGNNLFDAETSFAGEWQVDESMTRLAEGGKEAVIVGVSNIDGEPFGVRQEEYSPFIGEGGRGGKGDLYLSFLVETVKPLIDSSFRTLPNRVNTGIAGSSLGAFISLYALYARPQVFGFAGLFSPHFGFSHEIFLHIASTDSPTVSPRIYLDVGGREFDEAEADQAYIESVLKMADLLRQKGARLEFLIDPKGEHNERAWSVRFPDAMRWLLS